ncbi:putative aminoacyltransferase, E1 ubiquitin-activating enzyme [Rosa chinensis]|uniref:RING-type E3 ubiquitin transferase n=1 Tax=Rosa chinensis TaxID=74649 RepID=A0A2P6S640_ROSCH|nr:putative aminoacyltransferase, E1 ubiquitin-activating enzyme [Rosa chinensis]
MEKVRLHSVDFATRSPPCPICLEDFEEPGVGVDQLLPRLPCSHYFHLHRIIPWLEKNNLCPVSRYPMPTD